MVSPRKRDPSGKKVSKLYVEPAELARKLIKELEGTKSSRGGQTWVRDQYTVFLCREDFARFRNHLDQLVRKLESHMERHVQNKRYAAAGAITVELTMDPDLKPGYFGVLAEGADQGPAEASTGPRPPKGQSIWDVPDEGAYGDEHEDDYMRQRPRTPTAPAQAPPLPGAPVTGGPATGAAAPLLPQMPQAPRQAPPQMPQSPPQAPPQMPQAPPQMPQAPPQAPPQIPQEPRQTPPQMPQAPPQEPRQAPPQMPQAPQQAPLASAPPPAMAGAPGKPPTTPAMPATPASQRPAEPVSEPLVLKVNGQERVFPQGKAVVGRSRDADLQIDSTDVSRRHAIIYWSEGSITVKDLGSTNGTMVNGYPVDKTVVRPSDVIRIGNAHITVAPK